jgi:hypothetical protein
MSDFEGIGKIITIVGVILVVLGLIFVFGERIPFLGKLPGDILIKKDGISFYFPVVTFLLVNVVLTIIINFILRLIK